MEKKNINETKKAEFQTNECALITQRKEMKLQIFDPLCVSRLFSPQSHTHAHIRAVRLCAFFTFDVSVCVCVVERCTTKPSELSQKYSLAKLSEEKNAISLWR